MEHRTTVGDTTFVRVESGSRWEQAPRLRRDLEIGTLEGGPEETFGSITDLAVDASGGIMVFDAQGPALRYFDPSGRFVRIIGGSGRGPGEYGDAARGLFVLDDGRVLLRDMRNRRINLYAPDGAPLDHVFVPSGLFTEHATVLGTNGVVHVAILLVEPQPGVPLPSPWPIGYLRIDLSGEVLDTVAAPELHGLPEGRVVWGLHPDGSIVVTSSSAFRFEVRAPTGAVTVVELNRDLVPYSAEERDEYTRLARADGEEETAPPESKPSFKRFLFDDVGRIWAQRSMPAEPDDGIASTLGPITALAPNWRFYEPVVFDVFELDGTYLGAIRFPKNVRPDVLEAGTVHAVRAGDFGEHYVVRYRVVGAEKESF